MARQGLAKGPNGPLLTWVSKRHDARAATDLQPPEQAAWPSRLADPPPTNLTRSGLGAARESVLSLASASRPPHDPASAYAIVELEKARSTDIVCPGRLERGRALLERDDAGKRLPSPPAAPARHLVDRAACALARWRRGSLWHRGRAWSARGARDHQGEVAAAVHLAVLAAPARCRCCCARGCASRSFGRGRSRGRGPLSALDESAGGRSASSGRVGAEAASCRSLALSGGIDELEHGARPRASVRGPARGSRRAAGSRVASGRAETCGDRVCRTCYDSRRRPRCATRPAPLTRVSKCVSV